MNILLQESDS